jgi:hypothetical protein
MKHGPFSARGETYVTQNEGRKEGLMSSPVKTSLSGEVFVL